MSLITRGLNSAKLITQGFFGKIVNIIRPDIITTYGEITDKMIFTGAIDNKIQGALEIGKITFSGEIQ